MEVNYIQTEHLNKEYIIQIIEVEKEIIIIIQYKNQNDFNSLTLSQKTISSTPSSVSIYGDLLDTESQSFSQLFALQLNKRVLVSCNIDFTGRDSSKAFLSSTITQYFKEKHSLLK